MSMDLKRISAIILAAGQSKRMGQNKLLLPFQGKPMLMHTLALIDSIGFGEKILVISRGTADKLKIPESFAAVINENPEIGQSESVKLGLNAAGLDFYIFFSGDMPLLDKDNVLKLISEIEDGKIIVPALGNEYANPVIFPRKFRGELLDIEGDTGGRAVIKAHKADVKCVRFQDASAFRDIDTPGEYENSITL